MRTNICLVVFLLGLVLYGCTESAEVQQVSADPFAGKLIDLSHDFSDETIYWVNAKTFEKETVAEGMTEGGYYYSANNYSAA